jgi:hypothetical protein
MSTEAQRPPGPASPQPDDGEPTPSTSRITEALVPPDPAPRTLRVSGITELVSQEPVLPPPGPTAPRHPETPAAEPSADAQARPAAPPHSETPAGAPSAAAQARPAAPAIRPASEFGGSGRTEPDAAIPDMPSADMRSASSGSGSAGLPEPDAVYGPAVGGRHPSTYPLPLQPSSGVPPRPDVPPARSGAPMPPRPAAAERPAPPRPETSAPPVPPVETTARLRPIAAPPGPRTGSAPLPPEVPPLPPEVPPRPAGPPSRRRAVGAVDLTPRPGARPAHPGPGAGGRSWAPPESPAEMTTRLRPVRTRHPARTLGAVACVVLGLGLIGGAATGSWLTGDSSADATARTGYTETRTLWHSVPVDTLFPRTLKGEDEGPGGADRVWTRIAVAPDGDCASALDPLLVTTLQPVGCARVLRATYTDATASSVTTVGLIFTEADAAAMHALASRFTGEGLDERPDLMPRSLPAKGTVAAGFGNRQRASWTVNVLTEAPVVVYAVSGFADGRTVTDPQPADEAKAKGATSAPAQAGLGHEAKGIADRIQGGLRKTVSTATEKPE